MWYAWQCNYHQHNKNIQSQAKWKNLAGFHGNLKLQPKIKKNDIIKNGSSCNSSTSGLLVILQLLFMSGGGPPWISQIHKKNRFHKSKKKLFFFFFSVDVAVRLGTAQHWPNGPCTWAGPACFCSAPAQQGWAGPARVCCCPVRERQAQPVAGWLNPLGQLGFPEP